MREGEGDGGDSRRAPSLKRCDSILVSQFDGAAEKSVPANGPLQPEQSLLMFRQSGHDSSSVLEFCSRVLHAPLALIPEDGHPGPKLPKTVAQTLPLQKGGDVPEQLMPSLESSPLLVPISLRRILPRWGVSH